MWNPPLTDEALGARRSALGEAAEMLARLVRDGARCICFMKSRKGVELLARMVTEDLERTDPELAERVAPYRAGYTPQQRASLEERLISGELRAVITTDALELGIDIGELDAAVVVTFPGTVASLRQMWGRAGRRGKGLAVYVAGEDALDQFFCRHPDEFLERPVEAAILDHESAQIHQAHLLCAAYEGPLGREDAEFFGPRWEAHAEALVSQGCCASARPAGMVAATRRRWRHRRRHRWAPWRRARSTCCAAPPTIPPRRSRCAPPPPTASRSWTSPPASCSGRPRPRAPTPPCTTAPSICTSGRSYEVRELDLEHRRALVAPFDGDWYTQPKRETDTNIERLLDRREALGVTLSFGEVSVTETVLGYQRKRLSDHAQVDLVMLDLPQTASPRRRCGSSWTAATLTGLDSDGDGTIPMDALLGSLHATEHAQIAVLPLDRDVRPLGHRRAVHQRAPADGRAHDLHLRRPPRRHRHHAPGLPALRGAVPRRPAPDRRVPCKSGCPSCVQSPKCGNLNEPLSKAGANVLLKRMLPVPCRWRTARARSSSARRSSRLIPRGDLLQVDRGVVQLRVDALLQRDLAQRPARRRWPF